MVPKIALSGSPRMTSAAGEEVRLPARAYALLAALLLSPDGSATRNWIAELLWGQSPKRHGNLRKLLWSIRAVEEEHGAKFLDTDARNVRLSAGTMQIDLAQFMAMAKDGSSIGLVELCRAYSGDLLENVDLECDEWNDWVRVQRATVRDTFVATLSKRIEPPIAAMDREHTKAAARRLLEIEPYNEAACRALMQVFAEEGQMAQVQKVYKDLRSRLKSDLGTMPSPATSAMFFGLSTSLPAAPGHGGQGRDASSGAGAVQRPVSEEALRVPHLGAPQGAGVPKVCVLAPAGAVAEDLLTLATALMDDVTIGLCRSRSLTVLAPHTAWQLALAGSGDDALDQFGVDYVVETRLHDRGANVELSLKLISQRNREIVWVDQYPFSAEDVARCYRELSLQIVSLLAKEIERTELGRYDAEQHPTAYYWYLIGQKSLDSLDLPGVRRGRRALKSAVAACPDFAPAVSALARSYRLEWLLLARGEEEMLSQAETLARQAVQIDPRDARGYRELGVCDLYRWRFDASLESYSAGEKLNPQHADLLHDFADALVHDGQIKAAITKIRQAIDLNPLCPDHYWWNAGGAYYCAGEYRTAIDSMLRMKNSSTASRLLAASYAMLGEMSKARAYAKQAIEMYPNFSVDKWLEIVPLRDPAAIKHYEQGLRLAGFK